MSKPTVGQHTRYRFVTRHNFEPGQIDMSDLDDEIISLFDQSTYILTDGPNDNGKGEIELYIKDDMLFFYDTYRKKLVTYVKIDFGFIPEINRQICHKQTEYIFDLMSKLKEKENEIDVEDEKLAKEIEVLDTEIESIEEKLEALKNKRRLISDNRDQLNKDYSALEKQYVAEVKKLQYSINYRVKSLIER